MNSIPCSKLLLLLAVVVLSAGIAGAITVTEESSPAEVEVGDRVTATYVVSDLFRDHSFDEWDLQGSTDLESVSWSVQLVNPAGNVNDRQSYDGAVFNQTIAIDDNVDEVHIELTGNVPEVGNWSYEDRQSILLARFDLTRQGGTGEELASYSAARYTQESRAARDAIESARSSIDAAGGHQDAETTLASAVSAYNAQNFENAESLANQAERTAEDAQRRGQLIQLGLYGVGAIVVIGAIVGAIFWYRRNQSTSKL